jgi:hypothetical protein
MFARPVDSAIVAARAPWSVKCSVDTNETAAERGSPSSVLGGSLSIAAALLLSGRGGGYSGRPQTASRLLPSMSKMNAP